MLIEYYSKGEELLLTTAGVGLSDGPHVSELHIGPQVDGYSSDTNAHASDKDNEPPSQVCL